MALKATSSSVGASLRRLQQTSHSQPALAYPSYVSFSHLPSLQPAGLQDSGVKSIH